MIQQKRFVSIAKGAGVPARLAADKRTEEINRKKVTSFLLALVTVVSLLPGTDMAVQAEGGINIKTGTMTETGVCMGVAIANLSAKGFELTFTAN